MIYYINYCWLLFFRIRNKFRKILGKDSILLSSKKILEKNFLINTEFKFIQIGANDGISFDFLYDFVIKRDSKGIVIEPIKEYYTDLLKNYKNYPKIAKVNKAVHPTERCKTIYKINPKVINKYPDWVKGIASFDSEHYKKTNIDKNDIVEEEVVSDTLMNIVRENYIYKDLDYLQIDTEGFDDEVLKMIDFNFLRPMVLKYEYKNLTTKGKIASISLLKSKGYYVFNEFEDSVAVNLFKIKMF